MFRCLKGPYQLAANRQQENVPVGEIIDPRRLWAHMKIDRHGKAKILTQSEIQLLFSQGLQSDRDRALFAVMLYTACRVNEACTLIVNDVYDRKGKVRPVLIIRKGNTKGKLATRTIPVLSDLRRRLVLYCPEFNNGFLFPGRHGQGHLLADSASWLLREACRRVGIEGVSTHSFRRTALTQMSDAGIPLRVIQEISGHRTLDELMKYLEVRPDQVLGAIASLSMLTPVEDEADFGKPSYDEVAKVAISKRVKHP
jgi:integrase/recombinase XerD